MHAYTHTYIPTFTSRTGLDEALKVVKDLEAAQVCMCVCVYIYIYIYIKNIEAAHVTYMCIAWTYTNINTHSLNLNHGLTPMASHV